ncbi:hypothetical protein OHR68_19755 [Spirillospora sp. NBC_00431]
MRAPTRVIAALALTVGATLATTAPALAQPAQPATPATPAASAAAPAHDPDVDALVNVDL